MPALGTWGRRGAFVAAIALVGLIGGVVLSRVLPGRQPAPTPTPTPPLSLLRIESAPAGAVVRINGEIKGGTPLALADLPHGLYQIEVELSGFETAQASVALTQAEPTHEVSLSLKPATAAPNMGLLEVETRPPGATVKLDGAKVGTGPLSGFSLRPGTYTVTASLAEHETVEREIQITAGKTQQLSLLLRSTLIYEARELDSEPTRLSGDRLRLPTLDRARTVVAMLTIDYDGRVEHIDISDGAGPRVEGLMRSTIQHWRYKPGLREGAPVKYRVVHQVKVPGRRR